MEDVYIEDWWGDEDLDELERFREWCDNMYTADEPRPEFVWDDYYEEFLSEEE